MSKNELLLLLLQVMAESFGLDSKELARVRATAMEGSFGIQKEHYYLRRVKARTEFALNRNENMHIEKCFHRENYAFIKENERIRPKRPECNKNVNLMDRKQKRM